MNEATDQAVPFIALNNAMQPDYRAVVVKRALTFRRHATPAEREPLDQALTTYLELQVLDEQPTPDPAIVAALTNAYRHDNALVRGLLILWQLSQVPLDRRMREFLRTKDLPTVTMDELQNGFLGTSPQEDMIALVNEFNARFPSFNTYDAALMLCCVRGLLPHAVSPEPIQEPPDLLAQLDQLDEHQRTGWHRMLHAIRALPLDAPEWDGEMMGAFVLAVQRIGEQRVREREALRARLWHVLTLLREQANGELEYFGFGGVRGWSEASFRLNEIGPLADEVTSFYTQLMAHQAGLRQPPAPTRAEQLQRRKELDVLEEEILRGFERLEARFHTKTGAAPRPTVIEDVPVTREQLVTVSAPQLIEEPPRDPKSLPLFGEAERGEGLELAVGAPRRQGLFRRRG